MTHMAASVGKSRKAVLSRAGAGAPAPASEVSNRHGASRSFLCKRRRSRRIPCAIARAATKEWEETA
jgi:hypothetical protein